MYVRNRYDRGYVDSIRETESNDRDELVHLQIETGIGDDHISDERAWPDTLAGAVDRARLAGDGIGVIWLGKDYGQIFQTQTIDCVELEELIVKRYEDFVSPKSLRPLAQDRSQAAGGGRKYLGCRIPLEGNARRR